MADAALEASAADYNVYVPITNALGALGNQEAIDQLRLRQTKALEEHLQGVPEDARARTILSINYAMLGRPDEAAREATLALSLRPTAATVLYNIACSFCAREEEGGAGRLDQVLECGIQGRRLGAAGS